MASAELERLRDEILALPLEQKLDMALQLTRYRRFGIAAEVARIALRELEAKAAAPEHPLPAGTAVRFKRDPRRDASFVDPHLQERRGRGEGHGIVLNHSVGHGLCYLVKLERGARVWFDAEEVSPLFAWEDCRGR